LGFRDVARARGERKTDGAPPEGKKRGRKRERRKGGLKSALSSFDDEDDESINLRLPSLSLQPVCKRHGFLPYCFSRQ